MKRVLLGLGSNKSFNEKKPSEILKCGILELKKHLSCLKISSLYKTKAMYVEDQDDFYNMAVTGFVDDSIDASGLLKIVNDIEYKYGRNREKEIRFGPRSLDIDIELFGDDIINTPELQIPHIRMEERGFVLIPALEILDNANDSALIKKYSECLLKLEKDNKTGGIEKLNINLF